MNYSQHFEDELNPATQYFILDVGTYVNARDNNGCTPLIHAANGGHREVTKLQIAKGADVNEQDKDGATSLDWAIDLHDVVEDGLKGKFKETTDLLRKNTAARRMKS
jgi:hypothetical protein